MIIGSIADLYLKHLLMLYTQQPKNCLYDRILLPPVDSPWLPPVFLWCPVSHYGVEVCCPIHKNELNVGMWTDDLLKKESVKNPRLIYHLFENAILVQRFYYCDFIKGKPHRILSSDLDIMMQLPDIIRSRFTFIKHHKDICSPAS